jgi:hypothetical protein
MNRRIMFLFALGCLPAASVIIDRSAIIVGKRVVKESDIQRDIRITSFLNGQVPDFSIAARKKAASRLIDQELIRQQIRTGKFPVAAESEADYLLAQTKQDRFASEAQYRNELSRLGISESELKDALLWQLTVLRFIDTRFRPAVVVSDEDIQQYYDAHRAEIAKAHPNAKSAADLSSDPRTTEHRGSVKDACESAAVPCALRPEIEQLIGGERINKLLDEWLQQSRKDVRIEYLENSLQ